MAWLVILQLGCSYYRHSKEIKPLSTFFFVCFFVFFLPWSFLCHCQYALQYIVCSKKHVYLHMLVHEDLYIHSFSAFPHRPPPPHNVPACMATNEKPLRHLHLHTVHVPCSASLPTHTVTQNLTSSHASLSSLYSSHGSNCSQSVWLNILIWFKVIENQVCFKGVKCNIIDC